MGTSLNRYEEGTGGYHWGDFIDASSLPNVSGDGLTVDIHFDGA